MNVSELLDQLAISTLNNGLEVLSRGEELWPVAVIATESDFELMQFSQDEPESCREAAREWVQAYGARAIAYAVLYDGHIELALDDSSEESEAFDAVIVEFGERGQAVSYSMATPYQGAEAPGGFSVVADSVLIEENEQLLA